MDGRPSAQARSTVNNRAAAKALTNLNRRFGRVVTLAIDRCPLLWMKIGKAKDSLLWMQKDDRRMMDCGEMWREQE